MSYYGRGDFYQGRGDYYGRGDGKLGKFLGKVGRGLSKAAPIAGLLPGPFGTLLTIGGMLAPSSSKTPGGLAQLQEVGKALAPLTPMGQVFGGGGKLGLQAPTLELLQGGSGATRGMHYSKKLGRMVPNRHMNPLNPRALRRAYSRLGRAERWAHRLFTFRRPKQGVTPKFGKRRRSR